MKFLVFLSAMSVSCFCLGIGGVFGQQAIDLPTTLELARTNNPDWRAAEQEVEIARGKLTTARLISPFNPVIEGQSGRRTIPGESRGTD
jgi:hypothetical protein